MNASLLVPSLCLLLLLGCSGSTLPLDTVSSVDLVRYSGRWYEIASLPVSQQRGCSCTTAEYEIVDATTVRVINTCRKDGGVDRVEGTAFVVDGSNNAKLRVQFFWPFRGDYWVVGLDDKDYSWAAVGLPSRKYCWILSRTPTMSPELLERLVGELKSKGFATDEMQYTKHDCGG
jgi:apolipoprotein D and lipocalin family protein